MAGVEILSSKERMARFGVVCTGPKRRNLSGEVEVTDGIVFENWEPGGEYVQTLTVKNVSGELKKLKYKLPATRYLSLAFPEVISLSPGMRVELDVVFRPVEKQGYDDSIYFKLLEGPRGAQHDHAPRGFHVPVKALLATLQCAAPKGVDLGLCGVRETSVSEFELSNVGEVPAPIRWTAPEPFRLEPLSGEIGVGESVIITVSVTPTDATALVGRATCCIGLGNEAAVRPEPVIETALSCVGKFAFLSLSDTCIDFGKILAGTRTPREDVTRDVVLRNNSVVSTRVQCVFSSSSVGEGAQGPPPPPTTGLLLDDSSTTTGVFTVTPSEFVLAPRSERSIQVVYAPRAAGEFSAERVEFATPGGNAPTLTLTGEATQADVRLYKRPDAFARGKGVEDSVNFGAVAVGKMSSRSVYLKNNSDAPLRYQFLTGGGSDSDGPFRLSRSRGILPPRLEVPVDFVFAPQAPANYYRRLFVLVEHRLPILLDLLATAFVPADGAVKEQRPAPLRHAHVQAARNRFVKGWETLGPDDLAAELAKVVTASDEESSSLALSSTETGVVAIPALPPKFGKGASLFARIGPDGHDAVLLPASTENPVTRSGDATRKDVAPARELFERVPAVRASTGIVDFGNEVGGSRILTVLNQTRAKVSVVWHPDVSGAFDVIPSTADVGPNGSFEFRIVFASNQKDAYSVASLQATAYFKNQRSFRLVDDATLAPPWHVQVFATGHSFPMAGEERFAPQLAFEPRASKVVFPPCYAGDATYQIVACVNKSNLPAVFAVDRDPDRVFDIEPPAGLIPPDETQLFCVKFAPRKVGTFTRAFSLEANGQLKRGPLLTGTGHVARCEVYTTTTATRRHPQKTTSLETLVFPPTSIGLASTRTFTVANECGVPCVFEVAPPAELSSALAIRPRAGLLRGKERAEVKVTFAPSKTGLNKAKLSLAVKPVAGAPPAVSKYDARQLGDASKVAVVQTLACALVAPASAGVVAFEPRTLDFATVLVNTSSTQDLVLINSSDCPVAYKMYLTSSSSPPQLVTSQGKRVPLLVDEPAGVLPARSRTRVRVTFQPASSGDFDFSLTCRVRAVDRDGNVAQLEPEEAALLALGATTREQRQQFGSEKRFEDAALPLACRVKGEASFPTVKIRDARVERSGARVGCEPRAVWERCSLTALNKTLAAPLTPAEVALNLDSSPDVSKIERYPIRFAPAPLGSPAQVVLLDVVNPGALTTALSLHLPNEKDVELEPWADEGSPTVEDVRVNRIIDELKCFEITPRTARLGPGESVTLKLVYAFNSRDFDGAHSLPVLLRVQHGKQIWLDLDGRTLAPNEPRLALSGWPETLRLSEVAVGADPEHAPLQTFDLVNLGDVGCEYQLEISGGGEAKKTTGDDCCWEVPSVENASGRVEARSSTEIRCRFLPLQVKTYRFDVTCEYESDAGLKVDPLKATLEITGYDSLQKRTVLKLGGDTPFEKTSFESADKIAGLPSFQTVPVFDEAATLSQDRLDFGTLPQRARSTQIVIVRPRRSSEKSDPKSVFEYEWTPPAGLEKIVKVDPVFGSLQSNEEFKTFRITVAADCEPRVLDCAFVLTVRERLPSSGKRQKRQPLSATMTPKSRFAPTPRTSVADSQRSGGGRKDQVGGEKSLQSVASRESLASRTTIAKEKSLTQRALPSKRVPTMPTNPIETSPSASNLGLSGNAIENTLSATSLRTGQRPSALSLRTPSDLAASQSVFFASTAGNGASSGVVLNSSVLRVEILAHVVAESHFLAAHHGDLAVLHIPRPRVFVPPSTAAMRDPLASPRPASSLEVVGPSPPKNGPSAALTRTLVLRGVIGRLLRDALAERETRDVLENKKNNETGHQKKEPTVVPYYSDVKRKPDLATRLRTWRPDLPVRLPVPELRALFVRDLDVKFATASTKRFLADNLSQGLPGSVNLDEWIANLPPDVSRALDAALEKRALESKASIASKRAADRLQKSTEASSDGRKRDAAATRLQASHRRHTASLKVQHTRLLATDDGQKRNDGATRLQNQIRARKSRKRAALALDAKLDRLALGLLGDHAFQPMLHAALESTVFNLTQEALYDEFDLSAPPVQILLPANAPSASS